MKFGPVLYGDHIKSDIGSLDINLDKNMYVSIIKLGYEQTTEQIEHILNELKLNRPEKEDNIKNKNSTT